jgi:hypothetical protein
MNAPFKTSPLKNEVNGKEEKMRLPSKLPPLPINIGKKGTAICTPKNMKFRVLDEINHPIESLMLYEVRDDELYRHHHHLTSTELFVMQHGISNKVINFQKIQFTDNKKIAFRLGQYIIGWGYRSMRGKWQWGEGPILMSNEDFQALINKAAEKGWFKGKNRII